MSTLFFIFEGISILFSIMAAPIYIPSNSAREFPFLHILTTFILCRLINDGHADRHEVAPHCSLDLHHSDKQR